MLTGQFSAREETVHVLEDVVFENYAAALQNIKIYVDKVPMASCVVALMQNQQSKRPYILFCLILDPVILGGTGNHFPKDVFLRKETLFRQLR